MIDIRKILERGQAKLDEERAQSEILKKGIYRVGTVGAVSADGNIYGTCHRIGLARYLGKDKPIESTQKIMFHAGEANEDTWDKVLSAGHDGKILRQDALEVLATLPDSTRQVMGHPDIAIGDETGAAQLGIELKGIYGYTTAIQVFFEGRPKSDNIIQAAAYSALLKLPYALCYTCPSWVKLSFYDAKTYGVKNIKPFYRIFYMRWDGDVLEYRDEYKENWVRTLVTKQGIVDYYKLLEEMEAKKDLGPRLTAHYVDGTENKWGEHSNCGICDFASACDKYDGDKDFDKWIDNIGEKDE